MTGIGALITGVLFIHSITGIAPLAVLTIMLPLIIGVGLDLLGLLLWGLFVLIVGFFG